MASPEAIGAMIDTSLTIRQGQDDRETLLMAVVELLTCAPARINEVLYMRADCRRVDRKMHKGTDELVEYLGYAYHGSKLAPDSTRWIPSAMAGIADRALADVKRITQPYRDIALWMESHPGRAYVAEPWRLADPEMLLGLGDVTKAVGLAATPVAVGWMKTNGVKPRVERKYKCYRLGDIEAAILRQQERLPSAKLKLSDFMFLVPRHFFRGGYGTLVHTLTFVSDQNISDFLCGAAA